jgi:hypothetical protein
MRDATRQSEAVVIERRLVIAVQVYLWGALVEDTALFVLAWVWPALWFRMLHNAAPAGLEVALLQRSAGQWAAFALGQALTLLWWRRRPEWLAVAAGIRFSDLFTDISYMVAVPGLTTLGWAVLTPPPVLNLVGVVLMLHLYREMRASGGRGWSDAVRKPAVTRRPARRVGP